MCIEHFKGDFSKEELHVQLINMGTFRTIVHLYNDTPETCDYEFYNGSLNATVQWSSRPFYLFKVWDGQIRPNQVCSCHISTLQNCVWILKPPPGHAITVMASEFFMEKADSVTVSSTTLGSARY